MAAPRPLLQQPTLAAPRGFPQPDNEHATRQPGLQHPRHPHTLTIGEFDGRTLSSGRMYIAGNDTSGKSILVSDPA
ncbi:hypothetical protein CHLRE_07g352976v5 [Chlamydomonas reinhardtii]|uniref:Uncharacterized protein n=1 Tax=Chlamydomonas reinhardtii TaxID=3055 RepID=A0A2K3DLF0_CHLRE|nr:uncharacterized protein CHLRE_07g352976v5 [Chlamydomonas reinhardtii]PNW81365.1 hypothetical protein CHLRE_07g352976v5 [Chlamydomonas reinhardtii]